MFKSFLAAAIVAAFAVVGGSAVASATPLPILPFGNSNTVVNQNGVDFFQATTPVWGAAVNAGPANSVDNNFAAQSSGPNSVRFELVGTNLCVADPGPGYGNVDAIVLRTCNGKQWQAFRKVAQESNGLSSLQSVATNQYITDNGQFAGLTGLADNRPCAVGTMCPVGTVGANTFRAGDNDQLWRTGFRHVVPVTNLSVSQSQATNTDTSSSAAALAHDSVTYSYDVANHGSVPVSVNLNATEAVTFHVTATRAGAPADFVPGDYTANLSQTVETGQTVLAHSSVVDSKTVNLSNLGTVSDVNGPLGYDRSPAQFESDLNGATFHVTFVETPSVTATANGHAVNHIHVSPATETANF